MYCPLGAFIRADYMHRCKVFNASLQKQPSLLQFAWPIQLTGFSALQVAVGGSVGRQGLDLPLPHRLGNQD